MHFEQLNIISRQLKIIKLISQILWKIQVMTFLFFLKKTLVKIIFQKMTFTFESKPKLSISNKDLI